MDSILRTVYERFQDDFGRPASLIRLFSENPSECGIALEVGRGGIASESVVPWHELGTPPYDKWPRRGRGHLMGWSSRGRGQYTSFSAHRSEFESIGVCEVVEDWSCDITDVQGLTSSKSTLTDFDDMDEWVKAKSPEMVDEVSLDKLAENLAHDQVRIINSPGTDYFFRFGWDERLFLKNDGGSHHFAAARYIAARLSRPVPLRGRLYTYRLNASSVESLLHDFDMFVIPTAGAVSAGLYLAMELFHATWLTHSMPRPFQNTKAVLLPKAERRSRRAAVEFRRFGVTDLGQHLRQLLAAQAEQ
jgi:hypothetical protein